MILTIQQITVNWTKASRGGEQAAVRNATPEAFVLNDVPESPAEMILFHQHLTFSESGGFASPRIAARSEPLSEQRNLHLNCAQIRIEKGEVFVIYSYNMSSGGAPQRSSYPRKIELTAGDWLRIRFNGRFSGGNHGDWRYRKTVMNIGLFDQPGADIFLAEPPSLIDDMADLR